MSMSDHIKQQVVQEFFAKKVSLSRKTAKLDYFCFIRVGEVGNISKIYYIFWDEAAWYTVLNCCTMCSTEQLREQPKIGNRGLESSPANQF